MWNLGCDPQWGQGTNSSREGGFIAKINMVLGFATQDRGTMCLLPVTSSFHDL